MPCTWIASDLQLLLLLTLFLVAECISARMEGSVTSNNTMQQMVKENCSLASIITSSTARKQSTVTPPSEVNTTRSVPVDTKPVLSCPPVLCTAVLLTTWEVVLRDKPPCNRVYRGDTNETKGNCTDERIITWGSRPDKIPALQINPVAITHDGYYKCEMVTLNGNFYHGYHLQVLVPPEVTLVQSKDGTAVCKAAAGKPAAQISWTPERACTTVQEPWGNGTVTVQSTCHWEGHHVQNVSCSVSHLTGNKSLTIQLNQGTRIEHLRILYITSPVFIVLVIVGSIWLLKIHGCRKCKLKKTEPTPVVEEDEMQPYASYTEKNNPLYDTTNRVKTSQVSQS
ncbi:cell surface glycoprotein CD200 receptor 1 [Camelus ferus]|uniref:Cell surface glycoprotein CD200 receptor 1 n=2 Tax=Camelus TaxID=9836 RepID=A0A8B7KFA3_CAMFR|nr:cell surface glycoprotein CD200 receptor 1 [Camelus ferus]